ncbi:sugar-binding transcriptional regulator [Levilactobacillus cerevisiae]|uniref:sugar-binding transcriptional regulator n=1 Tax=Levilactobacillus cerevisiae TaxID=1704076 RepID=UPI000F77B8C7|nr:sugar-binding domain-containing protein [Levilactobacillus cerevisiae]
MENNLTHEELLVLIAQDYYYGSLPISDIARKYNLSRYLITKDLDEALKAGIVSIQINAPVARNFQLETEFKKAFDIPHVAILRGDGNSDTNASNIVVYAAERIEQLITESHVVGLAWGSTVHSIIDHFKSKLQEDLTFTQFVGENMKYNSRTGSTRMVEHAASRFEADYVTLPAPLYVTNQTVHDLLPKEPALQRTMVIASRMDMLFCGIGTISSIDSIPIWKTAKDQIFPGVDTSQIAGMLFGRPYDIHGNFLIPEKDTVVGISIDEVLATPRRFAVIKSKFKTYAALGALRGKLLTDLVIDEGIAQRILTANKEV